MANHHRVLVALLAGENHRFLFTANIMNLGLNFRLKIRIKIKSAPNWYFNLQPAAVPDQITQQNRLRVLKAVKEDYGLIARLMPDLCFFQ
jgi:hypothetical protein